MAAKKYTVRNVRGIEADVPLIRTAGGGEYRDGDVVTLAELDLTVKQAAGWIAQGLLDGGGGPAEDGDDA